MPRISKRATSGDKSYEQQVATLNVHSMLISQHIPAPGCPSKSGNVNLARQVAQSQGPKEPKHSKHSAL